MSIFKRGSVYWYHFLFNGEHIQESTKQGNPRTARQIEAAHRTALAKGEVGIEERKAAPMFADLAQRFIAHVEARHENKPQTVQFYAAKLNRLLEYAPIAGARLDRIDEGVIEGYVVARRASVGPATVNRELATLRRMLRLAHEWREIQRVPRIRLLSGERVRDFVLSRKQEEIYLTACPQPLNDIAVLMLETGLRIGEAVHLEWADITLAPVNGARFGFLRVREGKSKNARRVIALTDRAAAMLRARLRTRESEFVFLPTGKASPTLEPQSTICTGPLALQRSKESAAPSSLPILCSTLYAIQCLLGLGNREWMRSPSCGLPATAASWFRSGTSIQPRRQWSGLSSGCNCPAISPKTGQNDCHPLQYPLQLPGRLV